MLLRLRFLALLVFIAVAAIPLSAAAATSCCVCTRDAGTNSCRESRIHDGGTAAVAASRSACDRVTRDLGSAYTCAFTADAGRGCTTIPYCAEGVGIVAPLNEDAPAATPTPTPTPAPTETTPELPFTPAVPTLELPIPTLPAFSTLQVQGEGGNRYVDVPFVAEYIVALYRFSLGIIVTLAMVMIVIGGLRWVTAAGNAASISAAKETIIRAVMGLLIAFGSYTILFIINPELVNFRSIRVDLVSTVDETDENLYASSETPFSSPSDGGQYQVIAERVAQSLGFNGCLFSIQIGMESNWNPNTASSCCHGLGQVHVNSAKGILNNSQKRQQLIALHSQRCPSCPPQNADDQTIASWLKSDPEGNLILSGMLRQNSMRSAPNPIATTGVYGFGIGTYKNFIRSTSCVPVRFSEDELLNKLRSGVSTDELITQSCIPPVTWPLARSGLNCPGSNKCCRSATGACEQPSFSPRGRIGVCQGGSRDGQQCAAVAGGETYIRTYIASARRCAQ